MRAGVPARATKRTIVWTESIVIKWPRRHYFLHVYANCLLTRMRSVRSILLLLHHFYHFMHRQRDAIVLGDSDGPVSLISGLDLLSNRVNLVNTPVNNNFAHSIYCTVRVAKMEKIRALIMRVALVLRAMF